MCCGLSVPQGVNSASGVGQRFLTSSKGQLGWEQHIELPALALVHLCCVSVCLSVCTSVCVSVCLSVCVLFVYVCMYVCDAVCVVFVPVCV
jgi:hypothetical protein